MLSVRHGTSRATEHLTILSGFGGMVRLMSIRAGLSATALGLTSPTSMDEEEEGEVDDGRPLAGRGSVARNGIFTR